MRRAELSVPGAHCGACRAEILRALRASDGIVDAEVDLRDRRATVSWDPARTDLAVLHDVLAVAGYPATPWRGGVLDPTGHHRTSWSGPAASSADPSNPTAAQPLLNPEGER